MHLVCIHDNDSYDHHCASLNTTDTKLYMATLYVVKTNTAMEFGWWWTAQGKGLTCHMGLIIIVCINIIWVLIIINSGSSLKTCCSSNL